MNMLPLAKKLKLYEKIAFVDFHNTLKDVMREPDELLKMRLRKKAEAYLFRNENLTKHQCFEYQEEDAEGNVIHHVETKIKVPTYAENLFEGSYIDDISEPVADYIFSSIIGYDDYAWYLFYINKYILYVHCLLWFELSNVS